MKALGLFIKGVCIGAADVVPGVSGGTMALILGIYPRLISAIRSFDLRFARHLASLRLRQAKAGLDLALLLPVGGGIFAAWLFFTRIVPLQDLVRTHTVFVHGLFFGLIAASAIMLLRSLGSLSPREWALLSAAVCICAGGLWLAPTEVPLPASAPSPWLIALGGSLAASAMLLPGISGAFILLISGQYTIVLDGFARFDPAVLIPFGLGAGLGLMAFSRVIAWLLHRWERPTILVLVGLMIGALQAVWPFIAFSAPSLASKGAGVEPTPSSASPLGIDDFLGTVALMIVGAGLVFVLNALSRKSGA
ncbi:DUF368 domain-containing protein [Thioalkalivibrio sp. HK1]|uniref:DUF368 domain-containing protein n=1 Tax=Thioalkalivibrio sp. HK1 TaxID=1469245 RepID=UPI0004B0D2C2|nr:DUF368 domain-containing protein [Thioalkalivibrio sp. HK1]